MGKSWTEQECYKYGKILKEHCGFMSYEEFLDTYKEELNNIGGKNKMEKYDEIRKQMKENNLDMTRLYIYDIVFWSDIEKEEHKKAVDYIYDTWLDIDADICLARLCDIVCENWEDIKSDEYTQEDIEFELFS